MTALLLSLAALVAASAAGVILIAAGDRSGDRPGDITVTAVMGTVVESAGCRPAVLATVHNPGPETVLVGLSARGTRVPGWLGAGVAVSVPWRTTRRRFGPGQQTVIGVAAAGAATEWLVPVQARGRRCRLTVMAGQAGRRLRVIRLLVASRPSHPIAPAAGARPGGRQPRP